MTVRCLACSIAMSMVLCASVDAAERKAYKHVDEKGNITYSQTPPTSGAEAKKIDIAPAHRGTGGYSGGSQRARDYYNSPQTQADRRNQALYDHQKRREEAQQKRDAALRAECERNRGTDCNNPQTWRDMEAQRIPGGRSYQRR